MSGLPMYGCRCADAKRDLASVDSEILGPCVSRLISGVHLRVSSRFFILSICSPVSRDPSQLELLNVRFALVSCHCIPTPLSRPDKSDVEGLMLRISFLFWKGILKSSLVRTVRNVLVFASS